MSTIQTVIRSEPFFVRGEAFTGTEGIYILQHHQQEIERLQKQHNFILSSTGGVLVTAPLNGNNTLRVLDSGAADGTWLRSLAQLYPFKSWSLHGVDIASTPFPPRSADGPRLDLRRFDIRLPAPGTLQWTSSFDLINQRLLTWDLKPQEWPRVIGNLSRLLRPGGWIQLVECQWVDNNAPFDHAKTPQLFKMSQLQKWITATCGININVSYELEKLLKNAGLVNIQTTRFELGYGSKAREARWKQPSADMLIETLRSMRYKMPPEGIPGVANTPAEFDKFLDDLTDEIMEHGYAPVLSYVVGQKTPRVPIRYQL